MEATLEQIEVELIDDHPKNPRVIFREEVIDGIVANLGDEFPKQHAVHVRKQGDRFQLLSGHHRKRAAVRKGLERMWCWVEDVDDDAAFMQLVTANNQGELDPLEIGMHAYEAVPVEKGGRGQKGGGLKAYAAAIGQNPGNITKYRQAGQVAKLLYQYNSLDSLIGHALHLAAVHKLPASCWLPAAEWACDSDKSVKAVSETVSHCCECIDAAKKHADWFPPELVWGQVAKSKDFSAASIRKLIALRDLAAATVEDSEALSYDDLQQFENWLTANAGGDSWNHRKVNEQVELLKSKVSEAEQSVSDNWCLGDFREHVDKIEDGSVNLLLSDPPYGMDYQSNHRKAKKDKIAGDGSILDACDSLRECIHALLPKLADDAHILIFCRWDSDGPFQATLRTCGLTVKGSLVWVKNNHGTGDLKGSFAPKHERIVHAVKGSPSLFVREPDVLEADRVSTDNHPTEKPVDLLRILIEATTVEGQLVVDPFAGVASTCVAANEAGRRWFGCEVDEEYHRCGVQRLGGSNELE